MRIVHLKCRVGGTGDRVKSWVQEALVTPKTRLSEQGRSSQKVASGYKVVYGEHLGTGG